jgi:hypothetical protein
MLKTYLPTHTKLDLHTCRMMVGSFGRVRMTLSAKIRMDSSFVVTRRRTTMSRITGKRLLAFPSAPDARIICL